MRGRISLWVVLALVAGLALGVVLYVGLVRQPAANTIWYEVAKTSMQVLGVAVIGAVVSAATHVWQEDRKRASADVERQREQFELRTALLERASRCAQKMYVTCQHVRRVQRDKQDGKDAVSDAAYASAMDQLHNAYQEFSAEGAALETEIGARFGRRLDNHTDGAAGEAYLRWHQIVDLLTVYYFNLCGDFRKDVLQSNSKTNGEWHTGLDLAPMVADPRQPTRTELSAMRNAIRKEFTNQALPRFADALVSDKLREF